MQTQSLNYTAPRSPMLQWADHVTLECHTNDTWLQLKWGARYMGGGYGK